MKTNDKLKMLMTFHNISQEELAKELGISTPTLRARFEDGNWRQHEIFGLIAIFKINNPSKIFFEVDSFV